VVSAAAPSAVSAGAPSAASAGANIARHLRANALGAPDKRALSFPAGAGYGHLSYRQLEELSDSYARRFARAGIGRGTKALLMVKIGPDLFAILFALFKLGAVPVVVDPGMGLRRMIDCQRSVGAEAFIGLRAAQLIRKLYLGKFKSIIVVHEEARKPGEEVPIEPVGAGELLMINFTTGATGPAKGVEYTHGMAEAMLRQARARYGQTPADVTLASLPLFALFDLLLGSSAILPAMDPARPAHVDPQKMVDAIEFFQATLMFASPAFLHRVGRYAELRRLSLPSLRTVVCGGAPASSAVIATFRKALGPAAHLLTSYGATEALPISSIEAAEILGETAALTRTGRGVCAGKPMDELEARILRITEEPIPSYSDDIAVPGGEVGEIAVRGPNVSRRYHRSPAADALAKIADGDSFWHRTGDLGWLDERGRLWFCGRKSQRVETPRGPAFTVQWEGVFNAHPEVYRSALVGVSGEPVICVELRAPATSAARARIERELFALSATNPLTKDVKAFLFHRSFPVDLRHNAKIDREALARWAAEVLGKAPLPVWTRAIPIAGWLFVFYGLLWPLQHPALRAIWWVDVFLSVVAHAVQLLGALPRGRRAGYSTARIVLFTFLFGATWRLQ
jgi:acyl-CoA synthetase (AMP-forming)/AMP-acid ligase II